MRFELGLVLKHVRGGAEKVNIVKYLTRNPPSTMDCYYKVDSNVMNDQMEGFQPKSLGINRDNCLQGQGNKRQNYGNYNQMGQYV